MDEDLKNKPEEYWKEKLTSEEYEVLRQKGTERPFTGEYWNEHGKGMYQCRACGLELFSSETKFDSGTGWPSFTDPVNRENVELKIDESHGTKRIEVLCKRCGSHLGHVFEDGPAGRQAAPNSSGKRFCINSCALKMEKE